MIAAIYARVSTDEERQHVENQVRPCKEWCGRKGLQFIVWTEQSSGAKESRPQLDLMLQAIRKPKSDIGVLLVWKLDRLGRSLQHLLQLLQELRNRKIEFVSLTEGYDTGTPQGRFFFQIAGAFAEFEREIIRERINAGLVRAKGEGKHCGRKQGSKDKGRRRRSGYYLRWAKNLPPIIQTPESWENTQHEAK